MCKQYQHCLCYYHVYYDVYELLLPFNRIIIPFCDPINRPMILFAPILVSFTLTPTLSRHKGEGEKVPLSSNYLIHYLIDWVLPISI
jgi:hypothetical protein